MHKKLNKYLIAILILLLACVGYVINNFKTSIKSDEINVNISIYRIEEVIKNNITEREILKVDGNVLIGYSKKELENGYYDLKISNEKENLDIYVNKVWKEFDDKLYQEEYITQIVHSIMGIFEIDSKDVCKDLYEYILEGYKLSKGLIDGDINNEESLKLGGIKVKRNVVNSELILSMNKEVDK